MNEYKEAKILSPLPAEVELVWERARMDARLAEADVEFLVVDEEPDGNQWALHLAPGDPSTQLSLDDGIRWEVLQAIDRLDPDTHRVIVFGGSPPLPAVVIGALARHELRHAEQQADDVCYRIGLLAVCAHRRELMGHGPGVASLGREAPHEQDADSAAVALVGRLPPAVTASVRDGMFESLLTQARALEPIGSLRDRTIAFLALHANGFAEEAPRRTGYSPEEVLNHLDPDASAIHEYVSADAELTDLRAAFDQLIPSALEIERARPRPADAWRAARTQLLAAQAHAEKLVATRRALLVRRHEVRSSQNPSTT